MRLRAGIHDRHDDGSLELVVGFEWDGEKVRIIHGADTNDAEYITVWGIYGIDGKNYRMEQGEEFMRQIPWACNCSTAYGDIWEEKDGKWVPSAMAPLPGQGANNA